MPEIDKTQILLSEAGPLSSTGESNLRDGTTSSPTSTDHAMFGFTATSTGMFPLSMRSKGVAL